MGRDEVMTMIGDAHSRTRETTATLTEMSRVPVCLGVSRAGSPRFCICCRGTSHAMGRATMTPERLVLIIATSSITACAAEEVSDDHPSTCASERLSMTGAFDVETSSVSIYKLSGSVIGVAGFASPSASYSFVVRESTAAQVGMIGAYDVAATNLAYLEGSATANCQMPGQCDGFVATSGTFEVVSTEPYRATFSLANLHAYDGSSTTLGAAMSGTIEGCLEAAAD
jgi:hypothetical protein